MLKTIITHTVSVIAGFVLGLIFTYITTSGLKGKDLKKVLEDVAPLIQKESLPNKHALKTVISQPSVPNINSKPSKSNQDAVAVQQTAVQLKPESPKERTKKENTCQGQTANQEPKQTKEKLEASEKPEAQLVGTKTLKFKRLSTIKEIKLEVTLGMKDIFARVEKELLDVGTRVSKLLCKGRLLKDGFLESIPEGSTVSVMVRKSEARHSAAKTLKFKRLNKTKEIKLEVTLGMKEIYARVEKELRLDTGTRVTKLLCKGKLLKEGFLESIPEGSIVKVMVRKSSTLTEPPSTRPSTSSSNAKDDGLDFLDSVLDGLKEPKKLASKNQSIHPMMESKGLDIQKTRTKMSISKQKRIQYQVNKDIIAMQKVWNRRNHGLSNIYHQGLDLVNLHPKR